MALKARYTVVAGEVLAEKRGGVRRFYVPDPLGSTVGLLDGSQSLTDTFSYWPYGEEKARTGSTATPFRFVGTQGYYRDKIERIYVRARHLRVDQGRWLTEDLLGIGGDDRNLYRYCHNTPTVFTDRSGNGCFCCALSIFLDWFPTPQHHCNPFYAHCMACCSLSRTYGAWCASEAQGLQNILWGDPQMQRNRLTACLNGIVNSGNRGKSCHNLCYSLYPPPRRYPPGFPYLHYCKQYDKVLDEPLPGEDRCGSPTDVFIPGGGRMHIVPGGLGIPIFVGNPT